MERKLRDYQSKIIYKVIEHLQHQDRCCVSLATGGGKTFVFSELINRLYGKVLICVHRSELVEQTSNTLTKEYDILVSGSDLPKKDIVISMVETLNNRIKKKQIDINQYDYIIIDECHIGNFMKVLDLFKNKVIGFTATPNYEKKRYFYVCQNCGHKEEKSGKHCGKKMQKYKENIPLAEYYDYLIEGIQIDDLIKKGYLVKDDPYILEIDTKQLVFDPTTNDYTEQSISLVYGSDKAIQNTIENYFLYCEGLKTIIFNPNTLVNKLLFEAMQQKGINCKMYDSKNQNETRAELVEWFKNTPNAVLLNVQVFTTGFDVTDVECIFINKKTKSLNLFTQMVGRGGRITDKIFKPKFKVIDMGNNFEDFGNWSDKRDWNELFYKKEKKPVGVGQPTEPKECHECGFLNSPNYLECKNCGAEKKYSGGISGIAKKNGKIIIPTHEKIIEYCETNNLTTLQASKIVNKYVSEMFIETKESTFVKALENGELFARTKSFIKPYYFAIQRSKLEGNRNRTLDTFTNKTIKEIARRYNTESNI